MRQPMHVNDAMRHARAGQTITTGAVAAALADEVDRLRDELDRALGLDGGARDLLESVLDATDTSPRAEAVAMQRMADTWHACARGFRRRGMTVAAGVVEAAAVDMTAAADTYRGQAGGAS